MKELNLKWEIEILLKNKLELQKMNKDLDYYEGERLKNLRNELDKLEGITIYDNKDDNKDEGVTF